MKNVQRECQLRLELERTVLTAQLQEPGRRVDILGVDPVRQQVIERMQTKLQSVERALARLATGQFGICQVCRQPINSERLLVLPHAELCLECQRQLERNVIGRASLAYAGRAGR